MTAAQAFWRAAGAFAVAGCCVATPALATVASTTDVEVSRVTLTLPGADWKVSEPLPYGVAVRDTVLTVGGQSRLFVAGPSGTRDEIVALIGSHFAGLDAAPAGANLPARMPGGVAAWADKLSEAALGTLSSWSGRMDVPPVVFRAPPSPPVASSSAPASSVTIKD